MKPRHAAAAAEAAIAAEAESTAAAPCMPASDDMAALADMVACRYGGRYAGRVGYGYRGGYYRRGLAYGAVGAAAAYGAYGYYGNRGGCYYDQFGQTICPQQYPYRY